MNKNGAILISPMNFSFFANYISKKVNVENKNVLTFDFIISMVLSLYIDTVSYSSKNVDFFFLFEGYLNSILCKVL
jgi:hypothetical protein